MRDTVPGPVPVEACSGLKGSLDAVQWYAAPGPLRNPDNGAEPINGYWSLASNRIVLDLNNTIGARPSLVLGRMESRCHQGATPFVATLAESQRQTSTWPWANDMRPVRNQD
jgi:hypothetical protein